MHCTAHRNRRSAGGAADRSGAALVPRTRLLLLVGLWFLNLVNFMDGIDWMMVAEVVPIAGGWCSSGIWGHLAPLPMLLAAGAARRDAWLCAPSTSRSRGCFSAIRQPAGRARVGWLLLQLAIQGHLAAAPSSATLLYRRRHADLAAADAAPRAVLASPSHHFYQQATDRGYSVPAVSGACLGTNVVLAALAFMAISFRDARGVMAVLLGARGGSRRRLLAQFARGRVRQLADSSERKSGTASLNTEWT